MSHTIRSTAAPLAFKMERPRHRRDLVAAVRERENRDTCRAAKRGEYDRAGGRDGLV